jgi:hypothetical protein
MRYLCWTLLADRHWVAYCLPSRANHSGRAVRGVTCLPLKRGVVALFPIRGMDVFVPLFCVCVVLCRADLPSKEPYQLSVLLRK